MQCNKKLQLLWKVQMRALAAKLEKTELVEELCKEVGSGYHVKYSEEHQRL